MAPAAGTGILDDFAICEFNKHEGGVHVISRKRLVDAAAKHRDLGAPLDAWYRMAKQASWKNISEVRLQFPSADAAGQHTVFNIKGNAYRLIAEIYYRSQAVLIRSVLTHAEYDKGEWKK